MKRMNEAQAGAPKLMAPGDRVDARTVKQGYPAPTPTSQPSWTNYIHSRMKQFGHGR